ncbi:MAG: NAD(P)-binding domain-containing protein [Reichenbachiella sp.]|uniref:flavin-containing monooxygenase n=1 Tax=Reichenbachiella sp. TaxID=2184521 RepID=UPI002967546E|nr:NAD(P)-binding domain-containing protein [Reichenbachiella sp.]MDW3210637.1 NAD(P)-binding domain-containing protein [Reichenbachiella sp.]
MKKVCVIGAGPSGITAIKNLLDEGLNVTAYDYNEDVGGNWIYSEKESHSSVFETTHIISSKIHSQYEDFTFDEFEPNIPDYPSHDQLRRYFQAYAEKFDLYKTIQFNTLVKHCQWIDDHTWEVTIEQNGETQTQTFTDLIVSNGHHWQPRYPSYPGKFTGEYLHSHQFKKAAPFTGKKVLVIGGGNSACDVAVETSRVSKKTSISWRRGYRIVPKFLFGEPTDVVAARMRWLPPKLKYFLSGLTVRLLTGSNESYGLQKPTHAVAATHPTVNDELLYKLRHGKVFPKVDIDHFDGKNVHFKDGSKEEFDTVIACTGFVLAHPFFDKSFIDYSEGEVPLYLKMIHNKYPNLYFIGMFQPLGCIWPGSELQSKIAARAIAGQWKRPKNIEALCQREVTHPHIKQVKSARHTITVDYFKFLKELKRHLPKNYISRESN